MVNDSCTYTGCVILLMLYCFEPYLKIYTQYKHRVRPRKRPFCLGHNGWLKTKKKFPATSGSASTDFKPEQQTDFYWLPAQPCFSGILPALIKETSSYVSTSLVCRKTCRKTCHKVSHNADLSSDQISCHTCLCWYLTIKHEWPIMPNNVAKSMKGELELWSSAQYTVTSNIGDVGMETKHYSLGWQPNHMAGNRFYLRSCFRKSLIRPVSCVTPKAACIDVDFT